jgi:hypothetical protein
VAQFDVYRNLRELRGELLVAVDLLVTGIRA